MPIVEVPVFPESASDMPNDTIPDYYELLGVAPHASAAEIKAAYRDRAKAAHPDRGGSAGLFRLLRIAHDTLSDQARRDAYDWARRDQEGNHSSGTAVPDIIGRPVSEGLAALTLRGFVPLATSTIDVPATHQMAGLIVAQDPPPGTTAPTGAPVELVVAVANRTDTPPRPSRTAPGPSPSSGGTSRPAEARPQPERTPRDGVQSGSNRALSPYLTVFVLVFVLGLLVTLALLQS